MAVSPANVSEPELGKIFKRIYWSSKVLAVFPFQLCNGKYRIYSPEMVYSLISLSVYGYIAGTQAYIHLGDKTNLMIKLSSTVPYLTVFAILLVNVVWLTFNLETLYSVYEVLQQIQMKVNAKLEFRHWFMRAFSIMVVTMFTAVYLYYSESYFTNNNTVVLVFLVTFAVVDQFSSLLGVIRIFYHHICDGLTDETAEHFTDIHDMLAQCCVLVNHCYSPQLLLVSLAAIVYNVSLLYIAISKFQEKGRFDVPCILATLMFFIIVMHFTRSCRLTKVQSEKFNKLLYRFIINQDSRELMRNKRIMLHYKGTKDLQFSAIGFINVDYPLICSMVSTATTYILILVQFSG